MAIYLILLSEARNVGCPIIAAKTPFAEEICENYPKAMLFEPGNAVEMANLMLPFCTRAK